MKQIILDFPKQFKIGVEAAKDIKIPARSANSVAGGKGDFENVIVSGMGGSGLPGKLFNQLSSYFKIKIPIYLHSDYGLSADVNKKSLFIAISYSGNTEETISSLKEAKKKNLKIAVISSGGELEKLSKKYKIPFAKIPKDIQPRLALGYQFSALVKILSNAKIIQFKQKELLILEKILDLAVLESQAKKIAKKLKGKIPIIYSSEDYKILAYIWKINFNENSKIMAFSNFFPELNHNEMVGYTNCKMQSSGKNFGFYAIIIRDLKKDNSRILKRMEITSKLIRGKNSSVEFIDLKGKNIFEKIFSSIILANFTSYYLALEYKINPEPVEIVEKLKAKMKE